MTEIFEVDLMLLDLMQTSVAVDNTARALPDNMLAFYSLPAK